MNKAFKVVTCCAECKYLIKFSEFTGVHYKCAIGCILGNTPIKTDRPKDCPLPKPEE